MEHLDKNPNLIRIRVSDTNDLPKDATTSRCGRKYLVLH
jgi:hypothetical protein